MRLVAVSHAAQGARDLPLNTATLLGALMGTARVPPSLAFHYCDLEHGRLLPDGRSLYRQLITVVGSLFQIVKDACPECFQRYGGPLPDTGPQAAQGLVYREERAGREFVVVWA